jgi:hypothetical protein
LESAQVTRWTLGIAFGLGSAFLLALKGAGQQSAADPPALKEALKKLGVVADALNHSLPSLTCDESAISEGLDRGKVKQHVELTATIRAVRVPGGALDESFVVTAINGKPVSAGSYPLPYYTSGGFDGAMVYFSTARQPCYRYALSAARIDFETAPDVASHAQCHDEGLHGFALLDGDGNVTHIERRVSAGASRELRQVPFAAIDFVPVELNGQMYRLSRHMTSEAFQGRSGARFEATYTNCRLFTVTVKIAPATEAQPSETPASH